ncbi:MAG: site-2 protease family protein [Anaeromyxobacter sp.]
MPPALVQGVAIIVLLGGLIFVHELGHFLAAKLMGVKVLRFSIGFGSRLFGWKRGETEYWLSVLPLGGYVKMLGQDDPHAEIAPEDRGRSFWEQRPWRRLVILLAGPGMNLLLPIALLTAIYYAQNGEPTEGATIGTVQSGSPAEQAGLLPGDRIVSITAPDGTVREVREFDHLYKVVGPWPAQQLVFQIDRPGKALLSIPVTPRTVEQEGFLEKITRGVVGITPYYPAARVAPGTPGAAGPLRPFDLVVAAGGRPVKNGVELERRVAEAACAPLDLEVVRDAAVSLPGAAVRSLERVALPAVPTCAGGRPTFLLTDPYLRAFVGGVTPGSSADRAGLHRGDLITAVNGKPVRSWFDLLALQLNIGETATLALGDGRTVQLVVQTMTVVDELSLREVAQPDTGFWVDPSFDVKPRSLRAAELPLMEPLSEAVVDAWNKLVQLTGITFRSIVGLFTREVSTKHLGSVLSLASMAAQAAEQGLSEFLGTMAIISINLGLMNLLPVPGLDGGNIAQSLFESITRRPLSPRARSYAQVVGFVLVVALMILALSNDVMRKLGR